MTRLQYPDNANWHRVSQWRGFMYWWITDWCNVTRSIWLEIERA
jgi:hypothetical protein